jgi:cadmium resistance protein CadD (predicted permease)
VLTCELTSFSNISLSLGEDAMAIFLTWFATRHPYSAATVVLVFLILIVAVVRWLIRALTALFGGAEHELAH